VNVRKFVGATSREALRLTREALGADAAILSNRTLHDGQVEIVALADAELAAAAGKGKAPTAATPAPLATAAAAANPYAGGGVPDVFSSRFGASVEASAVAAPARAEEAASRTPEPWLVEHAKRLVQQRDDLLADAARPAQTPEWASGVVRNVVQDVVRRMPGETARPAQQETEASGVLAEQMRADVERIVGATVTREITALRDMMEERFAGLMWSERQRRAPVCGELSRFLFAAGFSADLVRQLTDNLPPAATASFDSALDWTQDTLSAHLPVLESEDALMERGGIYALMGPTGVGKTTTTAKLAARCVMRFGAGKVALLTTDSYRIGGHEQLRIYGRILGVPVHAIKDGADLQLALNELRNKHVVLIDTIGMSQRDRSVSDHIAMLHGADRPVQRLLLLNATSHADTLNEVVRAYSSEDQPPLAGCVLTKLDEATHLGGALDTAIRYKLPVHYVSTGQKVPENLYVATRRFLLKSAFCVPRDGSPFVPSHDEMPGVLASLAARPAAELHGVRLG
jgi:flagellar biosynthesis protein FlhF